MLPAFYPGFGESADIKHKHGKGKAMKFFRKFMKAFKNHSSSSSDSSSAERKEKKKEKKEEKKEVSEKMKKEYRLKRPQIIEKPSEIKVALDNNLSPISNAENKEIATSMTIKIQNGSPWPFWLTGVKKTAGDEEVKFEEFKYSDRLFKERVLELNIPVVVSAKAGEYTAKFRFLNKNGQVSGEEFSIKFIVSQ